MGKSRVFTVLVVIGLVATAAVSACGSEAQESDLAETIASIRASETAPSEVAPTPTADPGPAFGGTTTVVDRDGRTFDVDYSLELPTEATVVTTDSKPGEAAVFQSSVPEMTIRNTTSGGREIGSPPISITGSRILGFFRDDRPVCAYSGDKQPQSSALGGDEQAGGGQIASIDTPKGKYCVVAYAFGGTIDQVAGSASQTWNVEFEGLGAKYGMGLVVFRIPESEAQKVANDVNRGPDFYTAAGSSSLEVQCYPGWVASAEIESVVLKTDASCTTPKGKTG